MRLNIEFERRMGGDSLQCSAPDLARQKSDIQNLANLICVTNYPVNGPAPQSWQSRPYTSQNRPRLTNHQLSRNTCNQKSGSLNHFQSSSIHAEDSHSYLLEKTGVSIKPPLSMALTPSVMTKIENSEEIMKSETNMTSHICLTSHPARSG